MTIHVHRLAGCKPVPLAHYLKALGVLRLIAKQADPQVRGCFRDDVFLLCTGLDAPALSQFFLERYAPTPLIAPWNGGSGFYLKDNRNGIQAIRGSSAARFSPYRDAVALATTIVGDRTEAPKGEPKYALQRALRHRATGALAEWLDAVFVFGSDGSPSYPALLGTGGNDGRLDFTNNFMQRLTELFELASPAGGPQARTAELLSAALWDVPIPGLSGFAIGQFLPGAVGGANSGYGFRGSPAINPWDFILMLEGATAFHPSATKQLDSRDVVQAGAPFAFRASALGYASSSDSEEEGARGEQWMPLWNQPATFDEVSGMFAEGRSQLGRSTAQRPLDFARSVARLGVSRGIEAFQRYGFIERNGQANLAVPLPRWKVQIAAQQDLVDQGAQWVDRLRILTRADTAPNTLKRAVRRCEEALLAVCADSTNNLRWQSVLIELGNAERALLKSPKFTAEKNLRPLPALAAGWLTAAADSSPEWRIAAAVAALHEVSDKEDKLDRGLPAHRLSTIDWSASIRHYALPLSDDRNPEHRTLDIGQSGLVLPPHVVMHGDNLVDDLIALAIRRSIDPSPSARGTLGLASPPGANVSIADLAVFLDGHLDDRRIVALAWPLLAIRWRAFKPPSFRSESPTVALSSNVTAFALFRSAALMAPPLDHNAEYPRVDPSMLRALEGGDSVRASGIAVRRLRAVGLKPKLGFVSVSPRSARRLLASLMMPLSQRDARAIARQVFSNTQDVTNELVEGAEHG